jgi:hypothetical protein
MTEAIRDILAAILAAEVLGLVPLISRGVIWLATLLLPRARRELRRREWGAELEADHSKRAIAGLLWVLGLAGVCVWERATTPLVLGPRRVAVGLGGFDETLGESPCG